MPKHAVCRYPVGMQATRINATEVRESYNVKAADMNGYGLLHGGRLLTLADEIGFLAAHRFSRADCLTVAVHHARFHRPARPGDVLTLQAKVALTGNTSLWTSVEIADSSGKCIMDAVIVYSAVDKQLRPRRIGNVCAENDEEKALQHRMQTLKAALRDS